MYGDGGGKAQAPRRRSGRERVARFMVGIAAPDRGARGVTLTRVLVNGVPGRLRATPRATPSPSLSLDVADGQVTAVRIVANPDKLAHLQRAVTRARPSAPSRASTRHRRPSTPAARASRCTTCSTDDVTWTVPGENAIAGEYHGLDAVIEYFTRRRALAQRSFRMHPASCSSARATTSPR